MPSFDRYDRRNYETASVVDGYRQWSEVYDERMTSLMDVPMLQKLDVRWAGPAVDLACGTGRVGAWLKAQGVSPIDGVDLTPEMIAKARDKDIYRTLTLADVTATGLDEAYVLATQVLACEHLQDLSPLYAEAARLLVGDGALVIVGYHPYFMLNGVPTHFERQDGTNLAIEQYVHLASDHVRAGRAAGLTLVQMEEALVDDRFFAERPTWKKYDGWPITFAMVWKKC